MDQDQETPLEEVAEATPPASSTQTETPTDDQPPSKSADDLAVEAMDKGIEEASEAPAVEAKDEADDDADAAAAKTEPEPDGYAAVDVEAEMEALGIKNERSKTRFRELTGKVETLSKALAEAGVKDVADLPEMVRRAKDGEELISMVMDTGATAEHYGQALEFLKLDAAAMGGDKQAATQAFAILQEQMAGYARILGVEVPGVADPLADHEDLANEVGNGDLTRKRALEIAATRNQQKLNEANTSRVQQAEGVTRQQQEAVEAGRADLVDFDKRMQGSDPSYLAKREALSAAVADIRASKPPSEWLRETVLAYAAIPSPAVAAPAHKPLPGPVRGNRGTQGMVPEFKSMEEALDFGVEAATR